MILNRNVSPAAAAGLKAALVGLLVLVLLIPVGMIRELRSEREGAMEGALEEIASMAGGRTVLSTPYVSVPVARTTRTKDSDGKSVELVVRETYCAFPDSLRITGEARTSERKRGIYSVPVHAADFALELAFDFRIEGSGDGVLAPDWSGARLHFAYDDPRSLRSSPVLVGADGSRRSLVSGPAPLDLQRRAVSAPVALELDAGAARFAGRLDVAVSGARGLSFLPLADRNEIALSGDWPSPSFSGFRLPADREYAESGFRSSWFVDESGRTVPKVCEAASFRSDAAREGSFGVDFFLPTDVYLRVHRALRYAVLFLVIPFAALFLVELLSKRKVHPVQYLLIGLANCAFYLLLLAFSEHLDFGLAYAVAAAATVSLTAAYVGAVFADARAAAGAFLLLAAQYGYLYAALGSEDYALLIGSVGLLAMIGAAMAATRGLNAEEPEAKP